MGLQRLFCRFLLQAVITLWHYENQRIGCVLKTICTGIIPLYVCSPQFLLTMVKAEIINSKVSLRVFLLHFCVLALNWDCCVQKWWKVCSGHRYPPILCSWCTITAFHWCVLGLASSQ